MAIKGISTTKPSPLLWNSIVIRICRPEQRRHAGPAVAICGCSCSLIKGTSGNGMPPPALG